MVKTLQYVQTPWGYFEIDVHSELEQTIIENPEWQEGLFFGKPRYGHPEGKIIAHIHEVLANVENLHWKVSLQDYQRLRLITLIHDTFKHKVDETKPKIGDNHHAVIARKFAERYINDKATLDIIELHDEAYHAWCQEYFCHNPQKAHERLQKLLARIKDHLQLFYLFFVCDTQTGDKNQESLRWFERKTGIARVDARVF